MYDVGQLVRIRQRTWRVLEDHASHAGGDHILRVIGEEQEVQGEERTFIYRPVANEVPQADLTLEDLGLEKVEPLPDRALLWQPTTPPSRWQRLLTAYRLASTHDAGYLLGLVSSRLRIEPYQLSTVLQVMAAPRQRFLLAEDVGLGKTIEAGLIMMELIARGRADRILIIVPASLQDQWADELQDKFGLRDFRVIDSDYLVRDLIPGLPPGANPWNYANRVITSIDFAKQEKIRRALQQARWDLVIVDEAHYLAESGSDQRPQPTDRSRFGRMIAERCDSLLLLTATPHNGYTHNFLSLLRLLDEERFASEETLTAATVRHAMIRRTKRQILNSDGSRKFKDRVPHELRISLNDPEFKAEKRLYNALHNYIREQWQLIKDQPASRATVGFALTLLRKRMISSVGAIRASLQARLRGLNNEPVAADAGSGLRTAYQRGMLSEGQRERLERQEITRSAAPDEAALEKEKRRLEKLLQLAGAISYENDHKAAHLKAMLDKLCKEQGRKVIVFTEYRATLDYLRDYLEANGYQNRIATLHGSMNRSTRLNEEERFHHPQTLVLLATDAASEGLNFQHDCWTIIHNELPWNPNRLEQRNGRVDRWGQSHQVEIYNLVFEDTLEGIILQRLQTKLEKIRDKLGNVSDVLSTTGTLNLDDWLLESAASYEQPEEDTAPDEDQKSDIQQAVEQVEQRVDQALQEGQDQLDVYRQRFLITPGTFGPGEYRVTEEAWHRTEQIAQSSTIAAFVVDTLQQLHGSAEQIAPSFWSLKIPLALRHHDVSDHYPRATFERESALQDRSAEFISLGHPLLNALIAAVKSDARTGAGHLTGRMSYRILRDAPPGMLLIYLGRWQDKRGAVAAEAIIPIFVGLDGSVLTPPAAERLLNDSGEQRNAPTDLLEQSYAPHWPTIRDHAQQAARSYCDARAAAIAAERRPQLEILRQDIISWQQARLTSVRNRYTRLYNDEIVQQKLLLEQDELHKQRAREALKTRIEREIKREEVRLALRREEREAEISLMEQIAAAPPELIGALAIIPA